MNVVFHETVQGLNNGRVNAELSSALSAVITAVLETGKKGSITLLLTVERNKKDNQWIEISDDIKVKVPAKRQGTCFLHANGTVVNLNNIAQQSSLPFSSDAPALTEISADEKPTVPAEDAPQEVK